LETRPNAEEVQKLLAFLDEDPDGLPEPDAAHLDLLLDQHDAAVDEPLILPPASVAPDDRDAYLKLALVPGIGPRIMGRLLAHFGSADGVWLATLSQLGSVRGVGPKLATAIREARSSDELSRVLEHCQDHEVDILLPGDVRFPKLLTEIPDPPLLLFARGSLRHADGLAMGMVGTRHATHYGRLMAERIARGLCNFQMTIVSGLARGIDAVCHQTAIDAGGRTIAVLGSGVTDIYPPEHAELARRVAECGVLLSETPPFAKPKAGVFPQRNRLISGLSLGVIVVEAADRSGSLITARHAGEQGRDVFAVPGPVTSRTSRGCHQLIRDGAVLIQDAEDVLEHLGPLAHRVETNSGAVVHTPSEMQLSDVEQAVLQAIEVQATDIDQVITRSGLPVPRVLSTLSVLELRGWIVRIGGRSVARRF